MVQIDVISGMLIPLGRIGEHHSTQVVFDISEWVTVYGEGEPALFHQRQCDIMPYPVVTTRSGNKITWVVSSGDTACLGTGRCELLYYQDDALVKSEVWKTTTEQVLVGATQDPPDVWEDYTRPVIEAAASAEESAERAEEAASKYPKISENDTWLIWNGYEYVDTGVSARSAGYTHTQYVPASVWFIQHNLDRYPSVDVVDSAGSLVRGDVKYVNSNNIEVSFQSAFAGVAYLN